MMLSQMHAIKAHPVSFGVEFQALVVQPCKVRIGAANVVEQAYFHLSPLSRDNAAGSLFLFSCHALVRARYQISAREKVSAATFRYDVEKRTRFRDFAP
jgi:hypothetical protein